MIIAIDGPSASGKSTLGRMVARHFGLPLVDSGQMYRAVTVLAHDAGVEPDDAPGLTRLAHDARIELNTVADDNPAWEVRVDGQDLTGRVFDPALTPMLTRVSQVAGVRDEMVRRQREMGAGGVVMVGRDIGTVVFPQADLKIFLTASEQERERRRGRQMRDADGDLLRGDVGDRDAIDTGRALAPLRPAEDAYTIDTDGRSPEDVFQEILRLVT
jgi:cytidylate kinase